MRLRPRRRVCASAKIPSLRVGPPFRGGRAPPLSVASSVLSAGACLISIGLGFVLDVTELGFRSGPLSFRRRSGRKLDVVFDVEDDLVLGFKDQFHPLI